MSFLCLGIQNKLEYRNFSLLSNCLVLRGESDYWKMIGYRLGYLSCGRVWLLSGINWYTIANIIDSGVKM